MYTGLLPKTVSGRYIDLYKHPRALYTKTSESFKYSQTQTLSRWHDYYANGGSADFEVFYAHTRRNQELLVRVARGKALLTRTL